MSQNHIKANYGSQQKGDVKWSRIQNANKWKIKFKVDRKIKSKRSKEILTVVKNGFVSQASGVLNSTAPKFIIVAQVKVPSPVFHSFLYLKDNCDGTFTLMGLEDALDNEWICGKVFVKCTEKIKLDDTTKASLRRKFGNDLYLVEEKEDGSDKWRSFIESICQEISSSNESDE